MKLEELLGEELYKQVKEKIDAVNQKEEDKLKHVRYADLSEGNYVSKAKYDELSMEKESLNEKVKTMTGTIAQLKKDSEGNEELQKTITTLQTDLKNLQKTHEDKLKEISLKEQLAKAGVLDPEYMIYKAGGLEKFVFDKEGKPVGVDDVLKPYKENKAMSHLFRKENNYDPRRGGGAPQVNPFAKKTLNLTEQGRLLNEDPALAKELAAEAGVTII